MKKEEYLDIVEEQIRCRQARAGIREELEGHIEDQTEAYLSQGMEAVEAEEAAVADMGDPVETGNEMDRIHQPRMPWKSIGAIIGVSLLVYLLQCILRVSEPSPEGMLSVWIPGGEPRYLLLNVVGWGIMAGICYFDYTRIGKYATELMLAMLAGLFLAGLFANRINGLRYFIFFPLFGTAISLNMLFLLFVPLYGAILYRYRGQGYRAVAAGVLWMLPSLWMAFWNGQIWMAVIVEISYAVVLTVAVYKNWFAISKKRTLGVLWTAELLLPLLLIGYILTRGAPYQSARLMAIMDPAKGGYQVSMIRKLLAGSRMVGTKAGFLQDAYDVVDSGSYALSMICAYYGMLIAAALAVGIGLLLCRFFKKAMGQKNQLGMIMGAGVSVVFLVELLFYLLANTGWLPEANYCPFLGFGGSGMMVTYILLGILLSVYRYERVAPEIRAGRRTFASPEILKGEES